MRDLIVFVFTLFPFLAYGQDGSDSLAILLNGATKKTIELQAIKQMTPVQVEFYDYALRTTDIYKGVLLLPLIKAAVFEDMDKIVELEFISKNGYKSYVSMESFNKVEGVLTYAPVSGEKFEHFNSAEKKIVPLGPYYLVWDFKTLGKEDKFQYSSVYQITKINLITNSVDFGVHDAKVDEAVVLGYRTYKKYCLSCHALGGWGGDLSYDLFKRKSLENQGNNYIINYALNPQAINPQTKMLPLPKYNNRTAMAQGIVDFLKFVKNPNEYLKTNKVESDKARYNTFKPILLDLKKSIKK